MSNILERVDARTRKIKASLGIETVNDRQRKWSNYRLFPLFNTQTKKSKNLLSVFKDHVLIDDKIIELGSGTGRNLFSLTKAGYEDVQGVDISAKAIKIMRETFGEFNVIESSLEDWITKIPNEFFDVVFTMNVLQHLHKKSYWVFNDVTRITKKKLITIETEIKNNYANIFCELGFNQIDIRPFKFDKYVHWSRVFEKVQS